MNPTTLADVDTVIINANILTLDRDCPHAQAIAFAAGESLHWERRRSCRRWPGGPRPWSMLEEARCCPDSSTRTPI